MSVAPMDRQAAALIRVGSPTVDANNQFRPLCLSPYRQGTESLDHFHVTHSVVNTRCSRLPAKLSYQPRMGAIQAARGTSALRLGLMGHMSFPASAILCDNIMSTRSALRGETCRTVWTKRRENILQRERLKFNLADRRGHRPLQQPRSRTSACCLQPQACRKRGIWVRTVASPVV
jgi:hypothetical protein